MHNFLQTLYASMSAHLVKYLLCYDICDPKRLRRVHRAVRDWGVPIQYSVFEVEVNSQQLKQLMAQLAQIIDADEDKVLLFQLSTQLQRLSLGCKALSEELMFV